MATTAVAKRDQNEQLRAVLTKFEDNMARVLPKHLTPERMVTLTLLAATKTPALYQCSMESIAMSVLRISQWGLEIGTTAYLVPFKGVCTPVPAWQGLVEMILRSPRVRDVRARAVYSNERFVVSQGLQEELIHEPIFGPARGHIVAVYAVAYLAGNRGTFEVMGKDEVDRIRASAQSKDSPAWRGHYDEMAKKTVIRRLAKRLPQLSPALTDALQVQEIPAGEFSVEQEARVEPPQSRRFLPPEEPEAIVRQQDAAAEAPDAEPNYEHAEMPDELPLADARPARGRNAVTEGR
jgi:recombination protein RecT